MEPTCKHCGEGFSFHRSSGVVRFCPNKDGTAWAETYFEDLPSSAPSNPPAPCPTCGTLRPVEGNTTKYFQPVGGGEKAPHHFIKCWSPYFDDVVEGKKTFECRFNDRDYKAGDSLTMRHYDPLEKKYLGGEWKGIITYVLPNPPCGKEGFEGWCVFGITPIQSQPVSAYDVRIAEEIAHAVAAALGARLGYYIKPTQEAAIRQVEHILRRITEGEA